MSSSSTGLGHEESRASNNRSPYIDEDNHDGDNHYGQVSSDLDVGDGDDLLSADPLHGDDLGQSLSFGRSKSPNGRGKSPSIINRFLSPFQPTSTASSPNRPSSPNGSTIQDRRRARSNSRNDNGTSPLSFLNAASVNVDGYDVKDPATVDWLLEGPGRRVGYDNLTAIDWIFEYSKERQRRRNLHSNAHSFLDQLRILADHSQIWIILLLTGIAVGAIAAGIDVASDWLGDLKTGYCSNVQDGGKWWLNKVFCCWGYSEYAQCPDWRSWSAAMRVKGAGGSWIVDFLFYLCFSVLFASVASFLVANFSIYAKQSGIPEIKTVLGGFVIRRFMGIWTLVTKSLGLCLAAASGLFLGKEGPLVHVACCCANLFMKPFESINTNEARKREVLSAAAASGISVAFGAPVGGVLFSLEQLSYYFPDKTMWQSFVCAMLAAFTLKAFNPFRTGKTVQYQVQFHSGWHGFEIVPYFIIGILGGLYGGLFIKLNMKLASYRTSSSYPFRNRPILEVAVVAAVTAIVTFPITFLRAQATELDYYLFAECRDIEYDPLGLCQSGIANTGVIFVLIVSAFIAFLFTSITFGLQIPAGILLPSMTIGALYGRVVGLIIEVWQREHPHWFVFNSCEPDIPCVTPGTYAIIGAASALAGATRMTVSIVVIMFELTGALTYVLPIMIAVMIAKWVGDAFNKRGIYESWIHFSGYPFLDNRDDRPIPDVPVAQIMTRIDDLVVITAMGHTIETLQDLLRSHSFRGFPIVANGADTVLLGYISRTELEYAIRTSITLPRNLPLNTQCFFTHDPLADPRTTLDLRPWMDQTPITLNSKSGFQIVVNMFQRLGLRYVIFCDRGLLRGLLTKKDVWFVLNEDELVKSKDDMVAGGGVLREDGAQPEERGLLGHSRTESQESGVL